MSQFKQEALHGDPNGLSDPLAGVCRCGQPLGARPCVHVRGQVCLCSEHEAVYYAEAGLSEPCEAVNTCVCGHVVVRCGDEECPCSTAPHDTETRIAEPEEAAAHALVAGYVAGVLDAAERLDAARSRARGVAGDILHAAALELRKAVAGDRAALDSRTSNAVAAFVQAVRS